MKWPAAASLLIVGAFACAFLIGVSNPAAGQENAPSGGGRKPENAVADVLRAEADRSERAFQAAVAAVHELSGVLQAEASQSAAASRHDSEAIQRAMNLFVWIVGVVSAILVAGAGLLAWALAAWGKASKADIEKEVQTQTDQRIKEAFAADKARFDSMMDAHLLQTKSDLTKATDAQIKDFIDQHQRQLQQISEKLETQTKELIESVEVLAEVVENNPDDTPGGAESSDSSELKHKDQIFADRQTISNKELSVLRALWIKPRAKRTVYNIANDSQNSTSETRQVLSDLRDKGLVEAVPHSRTGRPVYRRTGAGVALTNSRFGAPVAQNS